MCGERQTDRQTETETERHRLTDRQAGRDWKETGRQRLEARQTMGDRQKATERGGQKEREKRTSRQTEIGREREKERESTTTPMRHSALTAAGSHLAFLLLVLGPESRPRWLSCRHISYPPKQLHNTKLGPHEHQPDIIMYTTSCKLF